MPDIVQQIQGNGTGGRIDGQGEVVHPVGTAGDDVADLVEHYLGTLAIGCLRIDRIEAACHVIAAQCQAVTDATRSIRPKGMTELSLHQRRRQGGAGNAIAPHATQLWHTLIHTEYTQFAGTRNQGHPRNIVQDHGIQAGTGAVTIAVRQHNVETFGQRSVIGRLSVSLVIAQGIAVGDAASSGHGVIADASDQQLIAQRAKDRLRETTDDLTVADKRDATQRQALDTVRRIEGKGTTLGQGRCVGGTAINQRGFIQDKLTPLDLQSPQRNRLIQRGDSDGQR